MFGADISHVPEEIDQGAIYLDVDGTQKPMLELLGDHGFNYVRLRTFVEPHAPYGYAYGDGTASCVKAEAYCDLDHTLEFGRQIKEAGMGFLLDFHYSDNWADPGKQIIPRAWRDAETIEQLAEYVRDYTRDSIAALVAGGARPDVVQIGNEITPGMLIHVPTSETDCWGNGSVLSALNGSVANWDNLATLLRAGIEAVKDVDPSILTMVHLENTESPADATYWIDSAHQRGVSFDILGMSCYPAYQGPPENWAATFDLLSQTYPDLRFVVAEYGPQPEDVIDVITSVPDGRGVGAFRWEPTRGGAWGGPMFTATAAGSQAIEAEFSVYDQLSARVRE
jgi:arabinogalactan endo-1,4-beta-galactosidase